MLPPIFYIVDSKDSPLKVLAGIVTNKGTDDIYLFGPNDDLPITQLSLLTAFSFCILGPGHQVNIEFNPHIGYINSSDKDKCITIHSDHATIEVDIESNEPPTSWQQDPHHPWNGYCFPNGTYTNKFQNPITSVNGITGVLSSGQLVGGGSGNNGSPMGSPGINAGGGSGAPSIYPYLGSTGNLVWPPTPTNTPPPFSVNYLDFTIDFDNIKTPSPKCTCGEKKTRHPGRCSNWCDLELAKDKNV